MDNSPDPYIFTRGEGQALVFKLTSADCSNDFLEALDSGEFPGHYPGYHRVLINRKDP